MSYILTKMTDIIEFNPRESIARNQVCKKVPMEYLQPFTRQISGYEEASYAGGTKFRNNDTIMARITPCLENGKTAFVKGFAENEVVFGSTEYIVMRAIPGASDPVFIYYLATSPSFREVAIKSMVGSSGRQRVQQDVLENLELILPDYETQVRVGKVLSAFDDKIELNAQINHNLEEQAKAIFKSWFVDFEPFRDGQFVDSELGKIPQGWKVGSISDLGNIVGGSTPSKSKPEYYTSSGIPWITPKDLSINKSKFISHGEIDITPIGLKNSSTTIMPQGTVLFSSRAPIGYIAIAKNEISTNQGFKSIVPFEHIGTSFVYCFLKENLFRIESMASGSTFKEVSGSIMKGIPAIVPDSESLKQFSNICNSMFMEQKHRENEIHALEKVRDTLLPKLMSGEIDVSEVEI